MSSCLRPHRLARVRFEGGRKVITRGVTRRRDEWEVLIHSWEEDERNRRTFAGNANMKGAMVPGSVRNGSGLLVDCCGVGTAGAS
jgi:hypothetical protein